MRLEFVFEWHGILFYFSLSHIIYLAVIASHSISQLKCDFFFAHSLVFLLPRNDCYTDSMHNLFYVICRCLIMHIFWFVMARASHHSNDAMTDWPIVHCHQICLVRCTS